MSDHSAIEWTEATWNPVVGCDQVSPGCAHCYAKTQHDRRHKAVTNGKRLPMQYAKPFETVQLFPDRLEQPLHWRKPRRVFVNSLSDLFHEAVPDEFIDQVLAVMALTPRHTYQVLTKRPGRMRQYFDRLSFEPERIEDEATDIAHSHIANTWALQELADAATWPLKNVWLGVSVENQHFADERIPMLLQTPAAVRFISAEPLLGPVDLAGDPDPCRTWLRSGLRAIRGLATDRWRPPLDWVIVGGESGPGARPLDLAWARSIVQQCQAAGVPVFVKQLGAKPLQVFNQVERHDLLLRNKKGGDPSEWPADLRVREFPAVPA